MKRRISDKANRRLIVMPDCIRHARPRALRGQGVSGIQRHKPIWNLLRTRQTIEPTARRLQIKPVIDPRLLMKWITACSMA